MHLAERTSREPDRHLRPEDVSVSDRNANGMRSRLCLLQIHGLGDNVGCWVNYGGQKMIPSESTYLWNTK